MLKNLWNRRHKTTQYSSSILILLLWCNFNNNLLHATNNAYELIAQENRKTLIDNNREYEDDAAFFQEHGWQAYEKKMFKRLTHPHPNDLRNTILDIMIKLEDAHHLPSTSVLDQTTLIDLELLCGPKSNPQHYVASHIDRTITEAGKVTLYRKLINPEHDIKELCKQQALTSHLLTHEDYFDEIDKKLHALVKPEHLMLSFWYSRNFSYWEGNRGKIDLPLSNIELPLKSVIPLMRGIENGINKSDIVAHIKKCEDWINKSPIVLRGMKLQSHFFTSVSFLIVLYLLIALPVYSYKNIDIKTYLPEKIRTFFPDIDTLFTSPLALASLGGFAMWTLSHICKEKNMRAMKGTLEFGSIVTNLLFYIDFLSSNKSSDVIFYKKVVYFSRYLKGLQSLTQTIASNKEFATQLPHFNNINNHLEQLTTTSNDLRYLFELLQKETFSGEYSSWNIFWERVEVAFRLIAQLKDSFIEVMLLLGEIDAQMSIVRLCKEFKDKRVNFCAPTYIDPFIVDTPSVQMINFWNPCIDPEVVIPSSLTAGATYQQPQHTIITGPNASGKSTITKAAMIAIIMAQSLGIAPAQSMTLTPFNNIITYLNITDDIAAGNSHFKAGVLRARKVNETFKTLTPHTFAIAAIDEVFNGTTPAEGCAAAYSLIKLLGNQPSGMCITNTHFHLITELEEETKEKLYGQFANYKVSVVDTPGEKITYPFKLERGVSHQNVAFKILHEEGFGDDFLNQAQEVLDSNSVIVLSKIK